MDKEFKPASLLVKISSVTFLVAGLIALLMPHGGVLGGMLLFMSLWYVAVFAFRYRKYIVTDTCLRVVNWNGTVKDEVLYEDMTKVFLHKGTRQTGFLLRAYEDAELLVIDFKPGETARFDITPIEDSVELTELVKLRSGL